MSYEVQLSPAASHSPAASQPSLATLGASRKRRILSSYKSGFGGHFSQARHTLQAGTGTAEPILTLPPPAAHSPSRQAAAALDSVPPLSASARCSHTALAAEPVRRRAPDQA